MLFKETWPKKLKDHFGKFLGGGVCVSEIGSDFACSIIIVKC